MSEKLGNIENHHDGHEVETSQEFPTASEALPEQVEQQAETKAEQAPDVEKTRERISKIHESAEDTIDEPAQSGTRTIRVPLHKLEPVVDTVAKTWSSIRQNLSPSQKTFSKVIHNPVISKISEVTAKTLARPYAILSGGVVAVIGSATYLYFTRHLGYKYNFFVPILLFVVGLAVGIIVEILYKLLPKPHKR